MLHARKATKGISEHKFTIKNIPFHFVDVGGQRSQRQKWYQVFEGVTSILFLASSSEFDQVIVEDRRTNRLVESCSIFETIVNNVAFVNVSIILFLNKTDLLNEKIQTVDIRSFFPAFPGNSRVLADVQKFEFSLFESQRRVKKKPLFHHYTTAVDTKNIRLVFDSVKDSILQDNLSSLMLQWPDYSACIPCRWCKTTQLISMQKAAALRTVVSFLSPFFYFTSAKSWRWFSAEHFQRNYCFNAG